MHELSIAQNILDIVVAAAEKEGAQKITSITLVAGETRAIVSEQLTFCFEVIAGGTIADGAELDPEIVPVRGMCRGCGEGFIVEDLLYICPKCQGGDIEIPGGTELRIKDIEVD